ncbi:MAG: YgiT-type zinc finger protein [Leptospirales bacterium]
MHCHVCVGNMEPQVTDMLFKLAVRTIAILKKFPIFQCDHCGEYYPEETVARKVYVQAKVVLLAEIRRLTEQNLSLTDLVEEKDPVSKSSRSNYSSLSTEIPVGTRTTAHSEGGGGVGAGCLWS